MVIATGNRLELLPPSLSQLTKLEVLTLSSNHVYRLPEEMVGMEKLKVRARDRLFRSNRDTTLTENINPIWILGSVSNSEYIYGLPPDNVQYEPQR